MFATASTVRSWLLLEHDGPWGVHVPTDPRMRETTRARLRAAEERGIRVLLIRRPRSVYAPDRRPSCVAIRSGPGEPWIERSELDRLDDVVDVELDGLANGDTAGMPRADEPLFLVCTHGRHDPCCAERGRPLARTLAESEPLATWECSHIGGDRFAGNIVAFPHGMYFGRVPPDLAAGVTAAYRSGRIDLAHYRGRSCYSTAIQAAEHLFRVERDIDRLDAVRPVVASRRGGRVSVTVEAAAERYVVTIERFRAEPRVLTCHDVEPFAAPVHRLVAIERVV